MPRRARNRKRDRVITGTARGEKVGAARGVGVHLTPRDARRARRRRGGRSASARSSLARDVPLFVFIFCVPTLLYDIYNNTHCRKRALERPAREQTDLESPPSGEAGRPGGVAQRPRRGEEGGRLQQRSSGAATIIRTRGERRRRV